MATSKWFANKVVLVTGGASGIGAAAALLYAEAGAKVVVSDINREGGGQTVETICAVGGAGVFHAADVSIEEEVKALVDFTVATYGRLDAAFNNAGILGVPKALFAVEMEDWQRMQAVNLTSIWLCMKYEIAQMLKTGGGAVVNTSSVAGLRAIPTMSPYVAAKHGVAGLTKTAAVEFGKAGIRVNAICPGLIDTPMNHSFFNAVEDREAHESGCCPLGRLGKSAEVAELALWLSSDKASYVTGQVIAVDGGIVASIGQ